MSLWIRSQDEEDLINNPLRIYCYNCDNNCKIMANTYDETIRLGEYKTKERALEVLDEIQKKITNIGLSISFGSPMIDLKNPFMVYKIPKE